MSAPSRGKAPSPRPTPGWTRADGTVCWDALTPVTAELLYLGVTGEQLTSRVRAMEGGEAQ